MARRRCCGGRRPAPRPPRSRRPRLALPLPDGHTAAIALLRGTLHVNDAQEIDAAQVVQFDRAGSDVRLDARADATFLVLTGAPINEPIAGYGPFVMNTREEITTALKDLQEGRFGQLTPTPPGAPSTAHPSAT